MGVKGSGLVVVGVQALVIVTVSVAQRPTRSERCDRVGIVRLWFMIGGGVKIIRD